MNTNKRRWPTGPGWPIWAVALLLLLSAVWLSDEEAQTKSLAWAGETRPWDSAEARAMVGTWYLVGATPAQADPHCAQDVLVRYALRSANELDYTLQCKTLLGRHLEVRGVVVRRSQREQAGHGLWWPVLKLLHLPNARRVMVMQAVDHPRGLASFNAPMDAPPLVGSRSRRSDDDSVQAFLRSVSMNPHLAGSPLLGPLFSPSLSPSLSHSLSPYATRL